MHAFMRACACVQAVRSSSNVLQPLSPGAYSNAPAAPALAAQRSSATNPHAVVDNPYHQRPQRDLQLELTVLKAIKSREDVLERLKVRACARAQGVCC